MSRTTLLDEGVETTAGSEQRSESESKLRLSERFWRNRVFARIRHSLALRPATLLTRAHAAMIRRSGGRIRRSFFFTGGMPVLVLTTTGRKSGRDRATPLGHLRHGDGFAVIASNAGSDRAPAWWLNLQTHPQATVLAERQTVTVRERRANDVENNALWDEFARLNPGFDE